MQLKNLSDGVALTLPDDLLWVDEHAWTPAVVSVSYLLTGALLVESAVRQKGRLLTLQGAADMAWVTRQTLNTLYAWAAQPLTPDSGRMELTLVDARTFGVGFAPEQPIEAEPVLGFPAQSDADLYRITLRLIEI